MNFCLKADEIDGMGFPVGIAAASFLVDRAGGILSSGTYSWMVPSGGDVRILLEYEG